MATYNDDLPKLRYIFSFNWLLVFMRFLQRWKVPHNMGEGHWATESTRLIQTPQIETIRHKVIVSTFYLWLCLITYCIFRCVRTAVSFSNVDNWANPSRIDPALLTFSDPVPGSNKRLLTRLSSPTFPVILLSLVCVAGSSLFEPSLVHNGSTKPSKFISGIFLPHEWERFIAVICMAFNEPGMTAPLQDGDITFST